MVAFPLERFTTDPNILRYSEPLQILYTRLLGELSSFRRIFEDLKEFIQEDDNWLLKKIRTWGLPDPEVLNGLFLKIYDANMATLNWPPLTYPETAPLLVHVPGYHGESEVEWSMRMLRKIGLDMHLGYAPTEMPPPYTPDMSNPLNPFERSWISDPTIREAFAAIHAVLLHPPPEYAEIPVNNPTLVRGLLSESLLRQNLDLPAGPRLPVSDNEIFIAYTRENTIYEDTICSQMSIPARFYGRILGSSDFDTFYAKLEKRSKEYDALFLSNSILPEKLTRKDLAWDQQLFTIIGPSVDPHKDNFHVLSRSHGGSANVPMSDTVWIQMASEPMSESSSSVCTIQGAYMSVFKPFLWLYFNGVHSVSPSLLQMLKGAETNQELFSRRALQTLIHPLGSLSAPFTLNGKRSGFMPTRPRESFHNVTYKARSSNFSPLMSNLRRLRKTLKKRSWHFWGPKPSKLVNEFIERYGVAGTLLTKTQEIRDAATALQMHHTTANKDALIQALKDAIRKYKASKGQLPLDTYTGVRDKPVPNLGGTNYSAYNAGINELETEMAKPWYAKTWGKSSKIIKDLLETYLELFSDKGDLNVVNALLALKKLKSHDAIEMLKTAIETRRYTARGLATPYDNRGSRRIPLMQTIRNERARLDPIHEPAERRGQQPWEVNMTTVRVIPELPLELPRADPVSMRKPGVTKWSAKAPVRVTKRSAKAPQETEANVLRGIEELAVKTVGNFRAPQTAATTIRTPLTAATTVRAPQTVRTPSPKSASSLSLSNSEASLPSLTSESERGSPTPNIVTVPLSGASTVKVPLQTGGFSPTIMSSFVTNGMRLLPAAAYLGYKQIKNRRTKKQRR